MQKFRSFVRPVRACVCVRAFVLSVCLSVSAVSFFLFLPSLRWFASSLVRLFANACVRAFCLSVFLFFFSFFLSLPSFLPFVRSSFLCPFLFLVSSIRLFTRSLRLLSSVSLFGLSFFYPFTFSVLVSSSKSSHDGLCSQCRVR